MITLAHYWMGRDRSHAAELTDAIRRNAAITVERVNWLLMVSTLTPAIDQITGTHVASGWRPAAVNARTANAASASTHMTGEGCDLQDHPDRRLARWAVSHIDDLARIGLWIEDPRFTGGRTNNDPWLHVQTRAPRSGRRVYVPSTAPAGDPQFYARYKLIEP